MVSVTEAPGAVVHRSNRVPAVLIALLAAVGVWLVWRVFVTTRTGQLVDQAAFDGADYGRIRLWRVAEPVLDVVSVPLIVVVVLVAMTLAVLQRRALLAVQVALLVGGANLTTQALKHVVLSRPDLGVGDRLDNALPSGHTTVAASMAVALLLVVPRRFRPAAAVVAVLYTVATGVSTLVGRWHRPSDVVAAVLVVTAWGALAIALGRPKVDGPDHPGTTRVVVLLLTVAAAAAAVPSALALRHVHTLVTDAGRLTARTDLLTAYGGAALSVVVVTCVAVAVLLAALRATEWRRRPRRGDSRQDDPDHADDTGTGGPAGTW